MSSIENLYEKYKRFALTNSEFVGEIETGVRWVSYFLPSRSKEAAVLSELFYCVSKLLVLLNDTIYEQYFASLKSVSLTLTDTKLYKFLAVLGCVEVFLEISSKRFGGPVGRWIGIVCIQMMKTICRLLLLFKYKVNVVHGSLAPSLNRKKVQEYLKLFPPKTNKVYEETEMVDMKEPKTNGVTKTSTFVLQSSGRVVRTLATDSHGYQKPWLIGNTVHMNSGAKFFFDGQKMFAELLYTFRPLVHLAALGVFGEKSWKPWLISGGLEVASVNLLGNCSLSPEETNELRQRTFYLLLYLIRSPFYSKYTKLKIINFLAGMKRRLPIANTIWRALQDYAQIWDRIYFYSWDS